MGQSVLYSCQRYTLVILFLFFISMKILRLSCVFSLILVLIMPVLGVLGVFLAPTADMYPPNGWAFMSALMAVGYMMPLVGATCAVCCLAL